MVPLAEEVSPGCLWPKSVVERIYEKGRPKCWV